MKRRHRPILAFLLLAVLLMPATVFACEFSFEYDYLIDCSYGVCTRGIDKDSGKPLNNEDWMIAQKLSTEFVPEEYRQGAIAIYFNSDCRESLERAGTSCDHLRTGKGVTRYEQTFAELSAEIKMETRARAQVGGVITAALVLIVLAPTIFLLFWPSSTTHHFALIGFLLLLIVPYSWYATQPCVFVLDKNTPPMFLLLLGLTVAAFLRRQRWFRNRPNTV